MTFSFPAQPLSTPPATRAGRRYDTGRWRPGTRACSAAASRADRLHRHRARQAGERYQGHEQLRVQAEQLPLGGFRFELGVGRRGTWEKQGTPHAEPSHRTQRRSLAEVSVSIAVALEQDAEPDRG